MHASRLLLVPIVVLAIAAGVRATPAAAATMTYSPGWHLVAAPPGTVFQGAAALDALDPATEQWQSLPLDHPAQTGVGYFAYFADTFVVRMAADDHNAVQVTVPANSWTVVGNPSAYSVATVFGADIVYDYDQQGGYLIESSIPPGAGALVYSRNGGTATVQPVPAGIEAQVADLTDKLVDVALGPSDVPANFHLTRADTNGDQNLNIPATYIEEFRPRTPPKPTDSEQTVLIQINLQQTKDAGYATTILNGTTTQTIASLFGPAAQSVETDTPPDIGDAAKLFHFQLVNGNTRLGVYLLAFRRSEVFAAVAVAAPAGQEDLALLQSLAAAQDGRIQTAF